LYQITAASKPLTGGLPPPDPRSLCPLSSTEFVEPPLQTKFLGMPLVNRNRYLSERGIFYVRSLSDINVLRVQWTT